MTYTVTESTPPSEHQNFGHDEEKSTFDWRLLILSVLLTTLGIWVIYSATGATRLFEGMVRSQIAAFGLGALCTAVILLLHYSFFYRFAYVIYMGGLLLLLLTLLFGKQTASVQRWLEVGGVRIQTSELMKIAMVICLARYFDRERSPVGLGFGDLILPGLLIMVPFALIKLQPNLGTAMILLLTSATMIFVVRVRTSVIVTLATIGLIAAPLAWQYALKPYQKQRVVSFLNPNADPQGAGYNSIQSMIAVGSGQLIGKGFKQGTQSQLKFLPENHTDFIFSVLSEEHGFLGSMILLGLFLTFFITGLSVAYRSHEPFTLLLGVGLVAMYFWQVFINLMMVIGLLPVVGVPLPFVSYGGSSLVASMLGVALLTNVASKKMMF